MPKRKRNKCDDSEYEYLTKKIKHLERKIKSGRRSRHYTRNSSTSESDVASPYNQQECDPIVPVDDDVINTEVGCSYWNDWPELTEQSDAGGQTGQPSNIVDVTTPSLLTSAVIVPPPATSALPDATGLPVDKAAPLPTSTVAPVTELDPSTESLSVAAPLDPDLLAILGEDPTSVKEYGDSIQTDLAIRLNHISASGLSKENRKELKDKYLVPCNCKMIKAPSLNPEFRASLIDSQIKRDKGIENKQIMNACALSSLSRAITLLLASDNKNQEVLKLLMDTARILGDIQHSDSILRRFFILSTVKKELKDQLEKTNIDEMLFGSNLAETLKTAKTISKSGADIRSAPTTRSSIPKPPANTSRPLNSRAPPASRRPGPAGGARAGRPPAPAPAPRTTRTTHHASGSRTSSRQPPPRYRR